MAGFTDAQTRDLVVFVGSYLDQQRDALVKASSILGKKMRALVIIDEFKKKTAKVAKDPFAEIIYVKTSSDKKIIEALKPFEERIVAVTARAEANIPYLKRLIPHMPYVNTPNTESLTWATEKILMRRMLTAYDKKISPKYAVVHDHTDAAIEKIEKKVGYPLVLKPSGLAASLLVSVCYHREELEENLAKTIKKIRAIYKKKGGRGEPEVLVEQLMEGSMYSIDAYVTPRGKIYFTPLVHVKTGRAVGFDDFFGYQRLTPVKLKPHRAEQAREVATKSIKALALRSTTCHIELMRTEDGWKIIELGPRIGGFRHEMYELSYGIDHSLNDILVRIPKKPIIPKKSKGYTAVLQLYGKTEGKLKNIKGKNNLRKLDSTVRVNYKKEIGDRLRFARHGGDPVADVVLFNEDRSKLFADIRRIERGVEVIVGK